MREIKFRSWSKKENKYYHEVGFHRSIIMWNDGYKKTALGALTVSPMFENYIIEQYTGLKDKNGVEIYFDDFVKAPSGNIFEVVWNDEEMRICLKDKDYYYNFNVPLYEIIGNIHEKSELMRD
jgi:uncharacterized phage protein (TIGR01671 family)